MLCKRKYLEGFVLPDVTHLSHTLSLSKNLITNENHGVIPACNMVVPFLVQPTTLSEFITCMSGFIEVNF